MSRRTKRTRKSVDQVDLREQVNLLTAENERLKSILAAHGLASSLKSDGRIEDEDGVTKLSIDMQSLQTSVPGTAAATTPRSKGCNCRGNCSTRVCGCVKKNVPCSEVCKCNDERCQNQEPNKENIGDLNVNGQVRIPNKPRSLFSPDAVGAVDQINVSKFDDISLRFDNQCHKEIAEQMAQGSETPDHLRPTSSSPKKPENVTFDPMKPRHNLSRSPITRREEFIPNGMLDVSEKPLPMPAREEPVAELPPPQELNEPVVDWEKHQAERVYCRKCGRGFYPYRIKKHEASCQKI